MKTPDVTSIKIDISVFLLSNLRGSCYLTYMFLSLLYCIFESGVIPIWAGLSDKEKENTRSHTNKLASAWTHSNLMFHVSLFSFSTRILNKNPCLHAIMFLHFASAVSLVLITKHRLCTRPANIQRPLCWC